MAEFLNRKKLLEWVPKLIETAEKTHHHKSLYPPDIRKIFALLTEAQNAVSKLH